MLSRYLDAIMIRTFAQEDVEELAEHADDAGDQRAHRRRPPCQALADLMTIRERLGRLAALRLAYLGDGNNVCVSLMVGAARFGMRFVAATPEGYEPDENAVTAAARGRADGRNGRARPRPARGGARRGRPLHRRLDEHGPGGRARAAPPRPRRLPDRRRARSRRRAPTRSCSTACRRTTARRSPRTCSTARTRPSGTRPRTACTRRRRCSR